MIRRIIRRLAGQGTDPSPGTTQSSREGAVPASAAAPPAEPSPSVAAGPAPLEPGPAPAETGAPELVLMSSPTCGYCRRVERTLGELGLQLPIRNPRRDPEARTLLRNATGRQQVPCLFIDGEAMLESADIIAWLRQNRERLQPRYG